MRILRKILKVCTSLPVIGRNISITCLVLITVILFVESSVRTCFNISIITVDEVCGFGMLLFIFLALAWIYQQRGHMRVGFLADRLPGRHILELFLSVLSLVFVGYLGYLWWKLAFLIFQTGRYTQQMEIIEWPFHMAVVASWGLLAIAILERLVGQVRQIFGRSSTGR